MLRMRRSGTSVAWRDAIRCPFFTVCPTLTLTAATVPETAKLASTSLMGATAPLALTVWLTVPC